MASIYNLGYENIDLDEIRTRPLGPQKTLLEDSRLLPWKGLAIDLKQTRN